MTLEKIKNDYAVNKGYRNFNDLVNWCHDNDENTSLNKHFNEVMKIYAMECLKLASDKIDNSSFRSKSDYVFTVKEVTNENNLIK